MPIDATENFQNMVELLTEVCDTLHAWNNSDQTGTDLKDFWNDMNRLHKRAEDTLKTHCTFMERIEEMEDELEEDEMIIVTVVDEGTVH